MKTFYIAITETLNRIVEVHAETKNDALYKAKDAYDNEQIVLDSSDFVGVEFVNETERINNIYDLGGMPKFYEVQ